MIIESYSAATGSGYSDDDAAVIGPELARLAELGLSTTEDIVRAAKTKRSPLHPYVFAYDDAEAARRHRTDLAGHVARSIQVTVVGVDGQRRTMRAFYPVRVDPGTPGDRQEKRSYVSITTIAERVDLAEQVRSDLWRQLVTWRSRARDFDDFFKAIVDAIDEQRRQVEEQVA